MVEVSPVSTARDDVLGRIRQALANDPAGEVEIARSYRRTSGLLIATVSAAVSRLATSRSTAVRVRSTGSATRHMARVDSGSTTASLGMRALG